MATDTLEIFGTEYTGVTGIKATDSNSGTKTYIRPQGTVTISASGNTDVTAYATASVSAGTAGTPTATKGTVSNHSVSVTPSVTNSTGWITGSTKTGTAVTVSASELVSGSDTKTANGTYDVTNLAQIVVSVSGGGGASNVVQGTFTTGSTTHTTGTFSVNYTGSGYPIAMLAYVDGGAYNDTSSGNTTWYNSVNRYDVGMYAMTKARITSAPSYSTGADNYGVAAVIYKNSTSDPTVYTRTSSMTNNTFATSSSTPSSGATCIKFLGSGTNVGYYIGGRTSSRIGFAPSTKYAYIVIYSS